MRVDSGGGPNTSPAADAAADAARRAEEARAAAAAKAAAEAAAAARAKAAAAAQAAAEAQHQAQIQADQARAAQQKVGDSQKALDSNPTIDPAARKDQQGKIDGARGDAQRQSDAARAQQTKADDLQKKAVSAGDAAIQKEKDANTAATAAGKPQPYEQANRVQDTYGAAHLDAAAQTQLFGTPNVVSPREVARHDAQGVQTDYDNAVKGGTKPEEAAAASAQRLNQLADQNKQIPGYADALVQEAAPQIDRVSQVLGDRVHRKQDDGDTKVTENAVRALAGLADKTSPQGALAIGNSLATAVPDTKDLNQLDDVFGKVAREGGGDKLASATVYQLQQQGKGNAAGELAKGGDTHKSAWDQVKGAAGAIAGGAVDLAKDGANLAQDAGHVATTVVQDAGKVALTTAKVGAKVVEISDKLALKGGEALINKGVDAAKAIANDPVGSAKKALELAKDVHDLPRELQQEVAKNIISAVKDPAGTIRNIENTVGAIGNTLDVNKQVDKLGPGDNYKISLSATGELAGLGGHLSGNLTITKDLADKGHGYTVAVDGEAGAGAVAELGGTGAVTGKASAEGVSGARAEFHFDTKEDAEKAARTLMGPVAGTVSGLVSGDVTAPDPKLLASHVSAVELDAGVAAKLSGTLGLGPTGANLHAGIDGKSVGIARIEFGKNGKANQLVLRETTTINANAGATAGIPGTKPGATTVPGANPGDAPTKKGGLNLPGLSADGTGTVVVTAEARFEIPPGVSPTDLITHPSETVGKFKDSFQKTGKLSLAFDGTASGKVTETGLGPGGSASSGINGRLQVSGKVKDVSESGAFGALRRGDLDDALRRLEPVVKADGYIRSVKTSGPSLNVGGGGAVAGGDVTVSGVSTDVSDPSLVIKDATLPEAERQLREYARAHRLTGFPG